MNKNNYAQCEKCGSKFINYENQIVPAKHSGIDTLTAIILLFFPVVGWVALIYLCTRKQIDSEIIAKCTDCGFQKNLTEECKKKKSKSVRRIAIIVTLIIIIAAIAVNIYFSKVL